MRAYKIEVVELDEQKFFGGLLSAAYTGPVAFAGNETRVDNIDKASLLLFMRLDAAMRTADREEVFIDEFAAGVLSTVGYDNADKVLVHQHKKVWFYMCSEKVHANTDVCVLETKSDIALLAQEDKIRKGTPDPEAQLIASAIGA